MFQDATLLPWLTARQNVELALRLRGVPARGRGAPDAGAARAGAPRRRRGQAARTSCPAACASAWRWPACLAQDAQIVLMDEPLGALDAMTRDHLHDEIERVWPERGLTVVFVTHNMREAVRLGDRVVLMASRPDRSSASTIIDLPRPAGHGLRRGRHPCRGAHRRSCPDGGAAHVG